MNADATRLAALDGAARIFAGAVSNGDTISDEDIKKMAASLEDYLRTGRI